MYSKLSISTVSFLSSQELLYTTSSTSAFTAPLVTSTSITAVSYTSHSLQTTASLSSISPTNSPSSTSEVIVVIYKEPDVEAIDIEGITDDRRPKDRDGLPLFILVVLLILIGVCSLVLAMVMVIGVYFRRRQSILMKTARPSSGGLELSVFNPLYVCPSILTEGVYQDSISISDFTDEHGLAINQSNNSRGLQLPPLCIAGRKIYRDATPPLEVTSENMNEVEVFGIGAFGEVALAYTSGLCLRNRELVKTDSDDQEAPFLIAVKKLRPNPSESEREAFEKEAQLMSQIKHPNVLRLLGVCHQHTAFIMMEYTERGDLNQFLQQFTEITASPSSSTEIATSTLLYMASQISNAMQYLAIFEYIHRDISTRKCIVGKNFLIKLADLGVNLSSYRTHYYCIQGNKLLPIRWMATECFSGKFSEKSDVWAFGVTLWELFTLAKDLPYPHLSDEEVIHSALDVDNFQPPAKPLGCPQSVYQVMQQCWAIKLQQRANFQEVNEMFKTCV